MATYKVWLTVKDSYGNVKELDGGTLNIDLVGATAADIDLVAEKLDPYFTTDTEVATAIDNNDTIKYSDFELRPE